MFSNCLKIIQERTQTLSEKPTAELRQLRLDAFHFGHNPISRWIARETEITICDRKEGRDVDTLSAATALAGMCFSPVARDAVLAGNIIRSRGELA